MILLPYDLERLTDLSSSGILLVPVFRFRPFYIPIGKSLSRFSISMEFLSSLYRETHRALEKKWENALFFEL